MAKKIKNPTTAKLLDVAKQRVTLPDGQVWLKYEDDVDILWVSFREKPDITHTDSSRLEEEGVLYHYHGLKLVAVEILDALASARAHKKIA